MLKKWGHTGKSLFYKSVLLLWAALEPIGYRIIFQKIQYSTRSNEQVVNKSWTSHEQGMNKSWTCNEQAVYPLNISYHLCQNKS